MRVALALVLASAALVLADDPADSWLSYASWTAPNNARITSLNTTFVVPSLPKQLVVVFFFF